MDQRLLAGMAAAAVGRRECVQPCEPTLASCTPPLPSRCCCTPGCWPPACSATPGMLPSPTNALPSASFVHSPSLFPAQAAIPRTDLIQVLEKAGKLADVLGSYAQGVQVGSNGLAKH